jgi:hypothetical protein
MLEIGVIDVKYLSEANKIRFTGQFDSLLMQTGGKDVFEIIYYYYIRKIVIMCISHVHLFGPINDQGGTKFNRNRLGYFVDQRLRNGRGLA